MLGLPLLHPVVMRCFTHFTCIMGGKWKILVTILNMREAIRGYKKSAEECLEEALALIESSQADGAIPATVNQLMEEMTQAGDIPPFTQGSQPAPIELEADGISPSTLESEAATGMPTTVLYFRNFHFIRF